MANLLLTGDEYNYFVENFDIEEDYISDTISVDIDYEFEEEETYTIGDSDSLVNVTYVNTYELTLPDITETDF